MGSSGLSWRSPLSADAIDAPTPSTATATAAISVATLLPFQLASPFGLSPVLHRRPLICLNPPSRLSPRVLSQVLWKRPRGEGEYSIGTAVLRLRIPNWVGSARGYA